MEEGELRCVGSSNTVRSEDAENPSTSQQSVETSHAVPTCNYAEVDQHTAPSGNPQRVGALYKDADVLHRWIDSHNVGTSTDAEPSQKENAQWRDRGLDVSGHLGSDCLHSEGREIIAKGIASVLGPVMRDFDAGAEGALKSQGVLASSIDRLTRELDKLLEDAPIPFIIQHATKISGVRKRVLSLNSTLQGIQRRIDNIERMLAGQVLVAASGSASQDSLQREHSLTSKGPENNLSSDLGEPSADDQSECNAPDNVEAEEI